MIYVDLRPAKAAPKAPPASFAAAAEEGENLAASDALESGRQRRQCRRTFGIGHVIFHVVFDA